MSKLKISFDIRAQVKAVLALLVVMLIISSVVSYISMLGVINSSEQVRDRSIAKLKAVSLLRVELNGISGDLRFMIISDNSKKIEMRKNDIYKNIGLIDKGLSDIKPHLIGSEIRQISSVESQWPEVKKDIDSFVRLLNSDNVAQARGVLNGRIEQSVHEFISALKVIAIDTDHRVDESISDAIAGSEDSNRIIIICGLISIMLALVFGWLVSRNITQGLRSAIEQSKYMGKGDLSFRAAFVPENEFGAMIKNMVASSEKLGLVMSQVKGDSSKMKDVADGLLDSSVKTLSYTGKQRESVDLIVSSIEELAATFSEIAENTQVTSDKFSAMSDESEVGKKVLNKTIVEINQLVDAVQESNATISSVEEEAKNIDQVLDVIRSVAEQTNLLALNAAIEAARAGESGRGFAVVADEVRSLAQRTHDSALEIQAMTETLRKRITVAGDQADIASERAQSAVQQAEETQEKFTNMIALISELNDRMMHTASTTEQQAAVAEEVMTSVSVVSDMASETELACQKNNDEGQKLAKLSDSIDHKINEIRV